MSPTRSFLDLNPDVSLSAGHDRMVVFARRASGELAHIDQVDNGKACDCYCLACSEALIARQGDVREHSFAHQSGTQCRDAVQAMLHNIAARMIEQHCHVRVPPLRVQASVDGPRGPITDVDHRPSAMVNVDAVAVARRTPWSRPCIVVTVHGRELLIHIALRQPASAAKRQALAAACQAAIEIDLSKQFPASMGELAHMLFEDDARTGWLFNPREAVVQAKIQTRLDALVDKQWREHRRVVQAQQAQLAVLAQHERERADRWRQQQVAELQRLKERAAAWESTQEEVRQAACPAPAAPDAPSRHVKPAELSPSVEFTSAQGRLWLLHSSQPQIHLRVEPGMESVLAVLVRFGAVPDPEAAGIYCISRSGWSSAALELGGCWTDIRSV